MVTRLSLRGEHLGEAVVGQIGRRGERRRQVGDADPAERAVLPGHFDPRLDHLGEGRFDAAGRDGVECRHQPAVPHLVDDRRGQRPIALGFGGLGAHQVTHAARQRHNAVPRVGGQRHGWFPSSMRVPRHRVEAVTVTVPVASVGEGRYPGDPMIEAGLSLSPDVVSLAMAVGLLPRLEPDRDPVQHRHPGQHLEVLGALDVSWLTLVPSLAFANRHPPSCPQPCGIATVPGPTSSVIVTATSIAPWRDTMRTAPPSATPAAAASSGCTRARLTSVAPSSGSGCCASRSSANGSRAGRSAASGRRGPAVATVRAVPIAQAGDLVRDLLRVEPDLVVGQPHHVAEDAGRGVLGEHHTVRVLVAVLPFRPPRRRPNLSPKGPVRSRVSISRRGVSPHSLVARARATGGSVGPAARRRSSPGPCGASAPRTPPTPAGPRRRASGPPRSPGRTPSGSSAVKANGRSSRSRKVSRQHVVGVPVGLVDVEVEGHQEIELARAPPPGRRCPARSAPGCPR